MSESLTQKTVLRLLSAAMFQKSFSAEKEVDWKAVFDECRAQSVVSLAFSALPKSFVPQAVYEQWKAVGNGNLAVNSKISYAHTMLNELLNQAEIPYVILKGCASAEYYDDPLLRTMGDVDFYVPTGFFERADKLLVQNGFRFNEIDHEYEKAYTKDDVVFELHNTVNGVPGGKVGAEIRHYFDDVFEKATLRHFDLAEYYSPSSFHHGLVMLLHVARHMITGGIGLRHFCDWAVFVDKTSEDFMPLFEKRLKQVGLWKFAQILTQFCTEYLGLSEQAWSGEADKRLLGVLKEDVFVGGNFGHKDLTRADEAKFITSRKKGTVNNDSAIKQAVLSANEIVRKHWKFVDKVPIVYPFGWAFFGGRYAIKAVIGKRDKVKVRALIEGAEKRKEIYQGLRMFEIVEEN